MRALAISRIVFSALALTVAHNPSATAQPSNTSRVNVVVNGNVNATVRIGNTLYIGGQFTRISPSSAALGSLVAVSPTTGQIIPGRFPIVDDAIFALLPDGSGGYYVGGAFDKVGGEIQPLLQHLNAAGQRIPTFGAGLSATVRALALAGGHLWVGGDFGFASGQPRQRLVALDPVTGQRRSFTTDANGSVMALAVLDNMLIVGGAFTEIAGQPRARLAAFDATTGALLPWNPGADNQVNALAVDGNTVYAGGTFAAVGGVARARIAAIDATTAAVTSWAPPPMTNTVNKLVVAGGVVYAGGNLSITGSTPRLNAAAFEVATGALTAWNPAPTGTVTALKASGGLIYVSGSFGMLGGQPSSAVAAVDPVTGAPANWNPGLIRNANVLDVAADGTLVVAGFSNATEGVVRGGLAAIDLVSGTLLPWNPSAGGIVAMAAVGNQIYIGGSFNNVNGEPRQRLAVIDATNPTQLGRWNPGANGQVNALLVANGQLYVGGAFTMAGGQPRSRLASFALDTGQLTSWTPEATGGPNPAVRVLERGDGVIYVGGGFQSVGGQPHGSGAAVDAVTGIPTAFNPQDEVDVSPDIVFSAVLSGPTLFVGGDQNIGLIAVDAVTAEQAFELPEASGSVNAVAVARNTLYAGGGFFTLGGQVRRGLGSIDLSQTPPVVTPWDPQVRYSPLAIHAFADVVVAVGNFSNANPVPATGVAVFEQTSGPPAAPQDFVGYAADRNVSLRWNGAPLGPATTGYVLEVGSTPGASNLLVMPIGNVTSLNTMAPSGTFYVRVRAVNAAGQSEPTPDVRLDSGCTTRPGQPLSLQGTVAGSTVTLNWLKGAGNVARYILEAGSAAGLRNLATVTIAAPTTTFSAAAPAGTYFLRVRAANACGTSDASAEIFLAVGSGATLPGAPSTPTVTVNGSAVSLAWTAPTIGDAPTGYVLEAGTAPNLANAARVVLGATPSFSTGGVPRGTYYVRVRAVNAAGVGPASADATVVVP